MELRGRRGAGRGVPVGRAVVVPSGPRRRANAAQFLEAVRSTGAGRVILLPNDGDTLLAANAAAKVAAEEGVDLRVVAARTAVQGIAALAVYDPDQSFADNVARDEQRGGGHPQRRRHRGHQGGADSGGPCRPGDVLGVVDGDIVIVGDDLTRVGAEVVERLLSSGGELLTVVSGEEATPALGEDVAGAYAATAGTSRSPRSTAGSRSTRCCSASSDGGVTVLLTEDSAVAKVAGPKAAVLLEKNKGIRTVGDLFEYLPRSYVATNTLTDMSTLREGQTVLVVAQVAKAVTKPLRRNPRQKMLVATITDGQNQIDLTFFKAWGHETKLVAGRVGIFVGAASRFNGRWQLDASRVRDPRLDRGRVGRGRRGSPRHGSRLDAYREHRSRSTPRPATSAR